MFNFALRYLVYASCLAMLMVYPTQLQSFPSNLPDSGFQQQWIRDEMRKIAEEIDTLSPDEHREERLRLCEKGLALVGKKPKLSDPPTDEDYYRFWYYCEYTYYFAAVAFIEYYYKDEEAKAIPYGEKILDAGSTSLDIELGSDSFTLAEVIKYGNQLGRSYSTVGRADDALKTYEETIGLAKRHRKFWNSADYHWQYGCLLSSWLVDSQGSEDYTTTNISYEKMGSAALKSLVAGVSSQYHDPDYMVEEFEFALAGMSPVFYEDLNKYKAIMGDTLESIKRIKNPDVVPVLTYLYTVSLVAEMEHGQLQVAEKLAEAALDTLKKRGAPDDNLVALMVDIAYNYGLLDNESKLRETVDAMRELATSETGKSDTLTTARISLAESGIWFLRKEVDKLRATISISAKPESFDLTDASHRDYHAVALYNLAAFDKGSSAYVKAMDHVIHMADRHGDEQEVHYFKTLKQIIGYYPAGVFWFDEPEADSVLPPAPEVPDNLMEAAFSDLLTVHEHAYLLGDWDTVELITAEFFRRGVSRRYMDSLFWAYDY